VVWLPTELTAAVTSFLDGPMDEPSLHSFLTALRRTTAALPSITVSVAKHPELLRSELELSWRSEAGILSAALGSEAADAAEWAIRSWIAVMDLGLTVMDAVPDELKRFLLTSVETFDESKAHHGPVLRTHALIMAAIEGVHRGKPQAVVADLVLRAFDEIQTVINRLHAFGVQINPFKGETLAERAGRARRYAEHVRNALSDDDSQALDEARLRRLR
jgi:hypothetical protein